MCKKEKYIIEECRHCGNKTKLDIVGEYTQCSDEYADMDWQQNWLLLKCCVCNEISLGYKYCGLDTAYFKNNEVVYAEEYTHCFPVETYNGFHVPDNIHNAFLAALKAKYNDNMVCILALRRTIEMICKDQNETKGNLKTKIKSLAKKNVFPSTIYNASDILRILGNKSAHGDDVEYDNNTVNEMIKFTQIIIEYVYVIPYRIDRIKKRLQIK